VSTQPKTLEEIRRIGLDCLLRELGPVGMTRFLQQFETGKGDYTSERHAWLDSLDVPSIIDEMTRKKEHPPTL